MGLIQATVLGWHMYEEGMYCTIHVTLAKCQVCAADYFIDFG